MQALLGRINDLILNPIVEVLFAVALLTFFWGIFQFISSEAADAKKREEGQKKIIYGLLGMFIMVSAYGLIRLILNFFGFSTAVYPINRL